jgi:beta-lactamase class A
MAQAGFAFFFGAATLAGLGMGWWARGAERAASPAHAEAPVVIPVPRTERLGGYRLVRPLLECERGTRQDPGRYDLLRSTLDGLAEQAKTSGLVTRVAIHVRDLDSTEDLDLGADQRFDAAPSAALPLALAVLKAKERNPALDAMRPLGDTVSPDELVDRALADADPEALRSLGAYVSPEALARTWSELGLEAPGADGVTARELAAFFRYLYNATWLGPVGSDRALGTLARARFRDGLVAGVPSSVAVAHQGGEAVAAEGRQLHDCGIVYFPGRPYLLCVMASGDSSPALARFVGDVSRAVYQHYGQLEPVATASR